MFGSKNKKPPVPKLPWAMQILTTEYLIEGLVQPQEYQFDDKDLFWNAFHGTVNEVGTKTFANKRLTDVQVQPTGSLAVPKQAYSQWRLTPSASLVAIIPNDDASRQAAQAACPDYKYPLRGVVYAGPYRIQCTVLLTNADHTNLYYEWSLLPVQAAEILPSGQFAGLQVPWLFLNSGVVHGIGVA